MSIKPVILWTDALIYLLVAVVIAFIIYARKKEPLRAPWRQVGQSKIAMASMIVLFAYIGIGLLDSIHFQRALDNNKGGEVHYSPEIISTLDVLLQPLRDHDEKTYSAPFATHLYSKETMEGADGKTIRGYPRLKYGGAYLQNPEKERWSDIIAIARVALLHGTAVWLILSFIVVAIISLHHRRGVIQTIKDLICGRMVLPWHVMLITAGVLILLGMMAADLGVKYHVFGTDKVGQDVMYQSLKSVRTGLIIGTLTTLVMLPFAGMSQQMTGIRIQGKNAAA